VITKVTIVLTKVVIVMTKATIVLTMASTTIKADLKCLKITLIWSEAALGRLKVVWGLVEMAPLIMKTGHI
jgi:hypothetical protein